MKTNFSLGFFQGALSLHLLVVQILLVLLFVSLQKLLFDGFSNRHDLIKLDFIGLLRLGRDLLKLWMFMDFLDEEREKSHEEDVSTRQIPFREINFSLSIDLIAGSIISATKTNFQEEIRDDS